jgi:hypothetical protein
MPKKTCFVIGPIGDPDTDTRRRADDLLNYIIKEVLEKPPFDMIVDRADEMQKPGLIPGQVIERVVNADLAVADLADSNPNVFYELALRHVSRKPVVHLLLEGQKLPFDIAPQRTIYYSTTSLASATQAKKDLAKHVAAVLENPDSADNPISAALLTLDLVKSKATGDQVMGRVLQEVSELRQEVRSLREPPVLDATSTGPIQEAFRNVGKRRLAELLGEASTGLSAEALRGIGAYSTASTGPTGPSLSPDFFKKLGEAIAQAPKCANCGRPIIGPAGRRSSDNAPIHWEGKCPSARTSQSGTPSTGAA